ncbi:MAG: AzlC family ABC transporter permease, partial [Sphaerochaetaceae bacterium]
MERQQPFWQIIVKTIPVMMGYIVLGIAFGLVMNQFGFNLLWAVFMSVFIYAGSLQFVLAGLLAQG